MLFLLCVFFLFLFSFTFLCLCLYYCLYLVLFYSFKRSKSGRKIRGPTAFKTNQIESRYVKHWLKKEMWRVFDEKKKKGIGYSWYSEGALVKL